MAEQSRVLHVGYPFTVRHTAEHVGAHFLSSVQGCPVPQWSFDLHSTHTASDVAVPAESTTLPEASQSVCGEHSLLSAADHVVPVHACLMPPAQ